MRISALIIKQIVFSKWNVVFSFVFKELLRRLYSNETHYGMSYDLDESLEQSLVYTPLDVREFRNSDVCNFFKANVDVLSPIELKARVERLLFLNSGIPTCYTGVLKNGEPVVICWAITADSNENIKSYFKGGLLPLKHNEVLMEFIFTRPAWRGKGFHGYLTKMLLLKAMQAGSKKAYCYVSGKNKTSIKVSESFGWKYCFAKKVRWRFFKKKIKFESYLPETG